MNIAAEKENLGILGRVRVKMYRAGTIAKAQEFVDSYQEAMKSGASETARRLLKLVDHVFEQGFIGIACDQPNLIMQGALTGKDLLVQYLLTGTIYTGINYGAIGTGNTTPAVSDTQLTTESARITPALQVDSGNNIAQIRFFFPDANLSNATYKEFGMFMNGTGTVNTGKLFNHSLFSPTYTKTTGVDTTVEVDVTFT